MQKINTPAPNWVTHEQQSITFPCWNRFFSLLGLKYDWHSPLQYLASLGIQSLVQQGATQGKTAHKLMDALKDTDILHWKHSLSELIEISLAQTTSIWRMYGKRSGSSPCRPNTHLSVLLTFDCVLAQQLLPIHIKSNLWSGRNVWCFTRGSPVWTGRCLLHKLDFSRAEKYVLW